MVESEDENEVPATSNGDPDFLSIACAFKVHGRRTRAKVGETAKSTATEQKPSKNKPRVYDKDVCDGG